MKIRIDKDIVTFTPEHAAEAAELEALWIKMGNCLGKTRAWRPWAYTSARRTRPHPSTFPV